MMRVDDNTLFGRLVAACRDDWAAYTRHEFVRRIGDGTLPEASFRHYLIQDYLFLVHFARAWALAIYKSDNLADMRGALASVDNILSREMQLHVQYCERWGISEAELEAEPEARSNMAYTRYVLERGLAGDVLDLRVALAPCGLGYAVIASELSAAPSTRWDGNPYRDWIESYSSDEYQAAAADETAALDVLAGKRVGTGRFDDLARTFTQATRLEIGFWDMGLDCLD